MVCRWVGGVGVETNSGRRGEGTGGGRGQEGGVDRRGRGQEGGEDRRGEEQLQGGHWSIKAWVTSIYNKNTCYFKL